MRLPTFKIASTPKTEVMSFNGINTKSTNPNFLYDAINLTGAYKCHSRKSRSPALLMDTTPDQIIPFGETLYFRYGNTLNEVACDINGNLITDVKTYSLNSLSPAPDRSLIINDGCLCILPDGIRISNEAEEWYDFGKNCDVAVALPFINSRTLFYSSGYSGGEVCDDAYMFNVGDKVTFSWITNKEFTVCAVDTAISHIDGDMIHQGTRVTLDSTVTSWNALPDNASMKICTPKSRKLLNTVKLGKNETVIFRGNEIIFYDKDGKYSYEYSLLNSLYVGQRVKITGSNTSANNKTVTITDISDSYISFDENFAPTKESSSNVIAIIPIIPSFDFVTQIEERIIGVDNSTKTFWVSRCDDPFVFHKSTKTRQDSWCCNYSTEVTGLTVFKDSVIAFTENGAFRLFGSDALNFGISQLHIMGMKKGAFKTFASIGDKMYYLSELGIIEFNSSSDRIISNPLPDIFTAKHGAAYKGKYFLLADNRIWVYDTEKNVWWSESAENIISLFFAFGNLYLNTQNAIYLSDGKDSDIDWSLETLALPSKTSGKIKPMNLVIKAASNKECTLYLYMKCDEDIDWQNLDAQSLQGNKRLVFSLCSAPCRNFKLKLIGNGDICFESFEIEYRRI